MCIRIYIYNHIYIYTYIHTYHTYLWKRLLCQLLDQQAEFGCLDIDTTCQGVKPEMFLACDLRPYLGAVHEHPV